MTVRSLYWSSHHTKAEPPTAADTVYTIRFWLLENLDALESDGGLVEPKRRNVALLANRRGRGFNAAREASLAIRGIITHGAVEGVPAAGRRSQQVVDGRQVFSRTVMQILFPVLPATVRREKNYISPGLISHLKIPPAAALRISRTKKGRTTAECGCALNVRPPILHCFR